MVVIRLARFGSTHRPKYRITVADSRRATTGKYIEVVGQFNPLASENEKGLNIDLERVKYWVSHGAQPTKRVKSLIKRAEA